MVIRFEKLSLFPAHFDDAGQVRSKARKVIILASLHPNFVGLRCDHNKLDQFLAGDARNMLKIAFGYLDFTRKVIIRIDVWDLTGDIFD